MCYVSSTHLRLEFSVIIINSLFKYKLLSGRTSLSYFLRLQEVISTPSSFTYSFLNMDSLQIISQKDFPNFKMSL
jgi:hypothetical protein